MTSATYADRTPLSVLLFHAAMGRELSISDFATELGIGPISLRQFIIGKTQRPRTKTLEQIAETLNISLDEVRERMNYAPQPAPLFGAWLEAQMGDRFSRARLGREAKISDGALRNYLANDTLPDADQARRLAEVLEVDPVEIAQVIVANDVLARGGELAPADEAPVASAVAQAPMLVAEIQPAPIVEQPAAASSAAPVAAAPAPVIAGDEDRLLTLWRRLHPQGRRATFHYMAELLAEG